MTRTITSSFCLCKRKRKKKHTISSPPKPELPGGQPPLPWWSKFTTVANFTTAVVVVIVAITAAVILAITLTSGEKAVDNVVNEYLTNVQHNVLVSFNNWFQLSVSQMITTATLFKYRWRVCPHKNTSKPYPLTRDSDEIQWWRLMMTSWITASNYTLFGFGVGFEDGSYYDVTLENDHTLSDTLITDPDMRANGSKITLSYGTYERATYDYTSVSNDTSSYDPRKRGWYKLKRDVTWLGAYVLAVGPPPLPYTGHMLGLYDMKDTPCGVLLMTWKANDLNRLLQSLSLGPDILMLLLEPTGLVMASTWGEKEPFIVSDSFEGVKDLEAAIANPDPNCAYSDPANGARTHVRTCRKTIHNYNLLSAEAAVQLGGNLPDGFHEGILINKKYYIMVNTIEGNIIKGLSLKLVTIYPVDRVMGLVTEGRDVSIGVSVGWAVFCIIVSGVATRFMLQPLNEVANQMDQLSQVRFTYEALEEPPRDGAEMPSPAVPSLQAPSSPRRAAEAQNSLLYEVRKVQSSFDSMKNVLTSFAKYVPVEIVRELMVTGKHAVLGMYPSQCTILFSDIVKFTNMCENMNGMKLANLVKEYFTAMTTVIPVPLFPVVARRRE